MPLNHHINLLHNPNRLTQRDHDAVVMVDVVSGDNASGSNPKDRNTSVTEPQTDRILFLALAETARTDYNSRAGVRGTNRRSLLRAAAAGRWEPTARNLLSFCLVYFQPGNTSPFLRRSSASRGKTLTRSPTIAYGDGKLAAGSNPRTHPQSIHRERVPPRN